MKNNYQISVPIVIFIFKRADKVVQIIKRISEVKPKKIYILADGPRNADEEESVETCRNEVEKAINWECEIIKNYAKKNRGVYENIAGGAKWVFEREEKAIFLEDDNLPEVSFFQYCEDLLNRYQEDDRILWICGTNYLGESKPIDGSDYFFTQMMLPCGWASWAKKFNKYYDGELKLLDAPSILNKIKPYYRNNNLFHQNLLSWEFEKRRLLRGEKPVSWDFQMAFTLRAHNLLGIAPKYNQISNIGADENATHGGTTTKKTMTNRFCEIDTKKLEFPLRHPSTVLIDPEFEQATEKIILFPLSLRLKYSLFRLIKKIFHISEDTSIRGLIKSYFNGKV